MKTILLFLLFTILCAGCSSSSDETEKEQMRRLNQKGEYLYRSQYDTPFHTPAPTKTVRAAYPWETGMNEKYSRINKEFFRCKGSQLNPVHTVQGKGDELTRYYDCGGFSKHSLPLRNGQEFIYPILIDLLNHIQTKTQKRVVITCGHRCPEHNNYADPSPANQSSKHLIGAEVSFYVQGMENTPEAIANLIMDYYRTTPKYKGKKEYEQFQRYEKSNPQLTIAPWYNQEIMIKLFSKKEGRNFDNRHPYAYIAIQVRYDMELQEKVTYSWEKAHHNYLRW